MVPEKRRKTPAQKLQYSHLMKSEKTRKWRKTKIKTEDAKKRKQKERMRNKKRGGKKP